MYDSVQTLAADRLRFLPTEDLINLAMGTVQSQIVDDPKYANNAIVKLQEANDTAMATIKQLQAENVKLASKVANGTNKNP
jgi:hypothetical protein